MAKASLFLDTDIFINVARFNSLRYHSLHDLLLRDHREGTAHKAGASRIPARGRQSDLRQYHLVPLSDSLTEKSDLRRQHPSLDKADALIAATALMKRLPLVTRNKRHFRIIEDLHLFGEQPERPRITGACGPRKDMRDMPQ